MTNRIPPDTLGYLLSRTYYAYKKAATKAVASYDITPEQYGILHRLSYREAISQKELAELHARDQTAVGKIIDKLERKKLVIRNTDPRDRRAVLLYLTEEGKQLIHRLNAVMQETESQAVAGLADSEVERFLDTMNAIFRNVHE
ncbi:MarR family winged helix-turn-helix transcriptional regulator [Cohnella thailandensis]|uniref:MarR family transcriptional regulator n=1 Tax=Cohnella thailandensis TaxID=557557 RepID=A0A841SSS7_9BACL|nr:MarR family transcriptional regulator [Cohnella thailandensis]MBB6634994.1 MarR family transcriptional regulator [Cohnella thailandensis]MBP1975783.1 DNA-binding MarR family transcriptional regulator [Cohnella thailandensis]